MFTGVIIASEIFPLSGVVDQAAAARYGAVVETSIAQHKLDFPFLCQICGSFNILPHAITTEAQHENCHPIFLLISPFGILFDSGAASQKLTSGGLCFC